MISVIIPAYNSEKTIGDCLEALLNQNYPSEEYEIIVVDDGSTDRTREIVKSFRRVRLIEQKHRGPAAARNLGVKKSKGSIILFTDSDCIPSKDWIKYMVEPFKNKDVVGVQGTYRTYNKESMIARFAGYEIEERHKKMKREIDFVGTFSAAYRKHIFETFGGFDTSFSMASGEDSELSFKMSDAGLRMVFQPKAIVYHRHPDSLKKFLRQKFWRGYWRVPLYLKHKKKFLRHSYTPRSLLLEIGLLGIACVLLVLSLARLIPASLFFVVMSIFFMFTLPLSFRIFKKDKTLGLITPFIILLRDFVTGLGIVYGTISTTWRTLKWKKHR